MYSRKVGSGQYTGQDRSGQVKASQARSGQVRSGPVRPGQVRSGQVKWFRLPATRISSSNAAFRNMPFSLLKKRVLCSGWHHRYHGWACGRHPPEPPYAHPGPSLMALPLWPEAVVPLACCRRLLEIKGMGLWP